MINRIVQWGVALLILGGVGAFAAVQVLSPPQDDSNNGAGQTKAGKGFETVVFVTDVVRKEIQPVQKIVGNVKPTRSSKVGSAASGRVESFMVNAGEKVSKGDPIVQLRTKIIEAELANAEATHEARLAELKELELSWEDEKTKAQAALGQKQAMMEFLQAKRNRAVKAPGTITVEELEEISALAKQGEEGVREAKAALKLLGEPRRQKIEQAKALVAAAKAEVDRLAEQRDRHTAVAPFDGYITEEYTESGEWVLQGGLLAAVAELNEVDVEVQVLEDYVSFISEGDKVRVDIASLSDRQFDGVVKHIVPQANLKARTFPVQVRVKNQFQGKTPILKSGMLARVELPVAAKQSAFLVPRDALVLGGAEKIIYIVQPDSKDPTKGIATPVPVELGVSLGDMVQVMGKLQDGQPVVIQGNERLRPGQPVVMQHKEAK